MRDVRALLPLVLAAALSCGPPRWQDFRAIGQEPGWLMEIEGGQITLAMDYGERRVTAPAPEPETPRAGLVIYRVRTPEHAITITIEDRPCQDIMSGEAFPSAVTVVLDGREYRGCGRALR
jgi:uncharacterized membrane protein